MKSKDELKDAAVESTMPPLRGSRDKCLFMRGFDAGFSAGQFETTIAELKALVDEHARYKAALDDVYGLLGIIYDDICDEDLQGPPGHAITVGIETINAALSGKDGE